jgi:hypothetical protein
MGVPKFPKLGFPRLWGSVTLCVDLWLRWGLKEHCILHWELSNGMLHATFMQGDRVDSWLLLVESQIANLIFDLSFGHNLCFRCSNGSCEPILDIYVSINFQWYKEFFNQMGFDPLQSPKMGVHLGVWGFIPSHSFALPWAWDVTSRLSSWPTTLQALALVMSPRLGLQ